MRMKIDALRKEHLLFIFLSGLIHFEEEIGRFCFWNEG